MTVRDAISEAKIILENAGIEDAFNNALTLMGKINNFSLTDYYIKGNENISREEYEAFSKMIERRLKHEPLQHILGTVNFYGFVYKVSKDVLIPRPETEILIEKTVERIKKSGKNGNAVESDKLAVCDMCTGSGCIIITLYKLGIVDCSKSSAVDISKAALNIARENASMHDCDVEFIESDLFTELDKSKKFNLIISNPPYIPTSDIASLSKEVREYDPLLALDGAEDGLLFYRRIIDTAADYLKRDGLLAFETGYNQGDEIRRMMLSHSFTDVDIIRDYAGLDRIVIGRLKSN